MVTGSSHSINMCPPHSPTRITKKSILKLPGAFHWPKTSRIRFWAFSYSIGEPCGRSNQLITYFIAILPERGGNFLTQRMLARSSGGNARLDCAQELGSLRAAVGKTWRHSRIYEIPMIVRLFKVKTGRSALNRQSKG